MCAGCVICCPVVSHGEYADGTNGQTDGRAPDRYTTLSARRGQRNNSPIHKQANGQTDKRKSKEYLLPPFGGGNNRHGACVWVLQVPLSWQSTWLTSTTSDRALNCPSTYSTSRKTSHRASRSALCQRQTENCRRSTSSRSAGGRPSTDSRSTRRPEWSRPRRRSTMNSRSRQSRIHELYLR